MFRRILLRRVFRVFSQKEGEIKMTWQRLQEFLENKNSQKGELTRRNSNSNYIKEKGDGLGPFGLNLKGSKSQSWAEEVIKLSFSQPDPEADKGLGRKENTSVCWL
ncbi:hypothetical protein V6N11_012998 [Hibiscus sabdariffa]|uniref:Uncharacterized protein n=2 Tax=Hibiscus sabdariffa TaxID=183260 RepID=A0ABR1ZZT8_9ROSI